MKELSLHILDIVQNSISAGGSIITIEIFEDTLKDILKISITDNGCGMDKDTINKVKDPFFTSRSTRRVGLGIPLLLAAVRRCEGDLTIDSEPGKGTRVTAFFKRGHIDRAPLGNMEDTLASLIACNEKVEFEYIHIYNHKKFQMSTTEIKETLKEVPITSPEVIEWIREYVKEGIKDLYGGVELENHTGTGGNKEKDAGNYQR